MENRGRHPGDGFCQFHGCLVSGQGAGMGRSRAGHPTTASLGATYTTLKMSGQVHRVPGLVSGETEALPATQRTTRSPVGRTSQQLSHPRRGRVPRETWGPGTGAGASNHPSPGGEGPGGRDPPPRKGSLRGTQAWDPPGRLRVLLYSNCPTRHQGCKLGPIDYYSLQSGLHYNRRNCDHCDLGPPELQTPLLEDISSLRSLMSPKGIHQQRTWAQ